MKNWKDISDNEFDELFKKSSQLAKPELKDSYWLEFEPRLDEANIGGKDSFIKKRTFLAILAIFLIAGFIGTKNYWNSKQPAQNESNLALNDQKLDDKTHRQEKSIDTKDEILELKEKSNYQSNGEVISNEENKNIVISNQNELQNANLSTNSIILEKKSNISKKITNSNSSLKTTNSSFTFQNYLSNNNRLEKSQPKENLNELQAKDGFKSSENTSSEYNLSKNENTVSTIDEFDLGSKSFEVGFPSKIKGKEFKPLLAENKFLQTPADYNRPSKEIEITKDRKFENKVYLTLGVSPDFSKVIDNSFLKMGYNWSGQLEYHLNKRWSFQSGVIISEKYYSSDPNGIVWPTRWGTIPKEMKGMEGSCKVVDIPLNIRYNLKSNEKSKMYIVGGVSSFFILNEKYDYFYPEGFTFEGIKTKWSRKDKEFLATAMANFSIGYERKIGNIFSIQIEPFVKIPTRDFGFTQVKLASTGVFVTGKVRLK